MVQRPNRRLFERDNGTQTQQTPAMDTERPHGLLAWQWDNYATNHKHPTNLVIHAVTVPLFWLGALSVVTAPFVGWAGLGGLVPMALAAALQGRGHKLESVGPLPFRGPFDAVKRLWWEQWITFPKFVLSGRWSQARRDAKSVG
jgi:hypothetical protein